MNFEYYNFENAYQLRFGRLHITIPKLNDPHFWYYFVPILNIALIVHKGNIHWCNHDLKMKQEMKKLKKKCLNQNQT